VNASRTLAASIQQQSDRAGDPLAQILLGFRELSKDDHGSDRTVDHRVQELPGQEAGVGRSYLSVAHGVGEDVGDQASRVNVILVVGKRQLRELMRFGPDQPVKRNGCRRQRSFRVANKATPRMGNQRGKRPPGSAGAR
jgi:hypothetical protein